MAVTAYIEAARVVARGVASGIRAAYAGSRLLAEAWDGADSLQHVIAYGESDGAMRPPEESQARSTITP